jgi:serpin B
MNGQVTNQSDDTVKLNRRDVLAAALALAAGSPIINRAAGAAGLPKSAAPGDRLASAQGALAMRLIAAIARAPASPNIVISPASLAGALSVIERGGSPLLQSNLHRVLGFDRSPAAWSDFETLRRVTNRSRNQDGPLSSANALYMDAAIAPYEHVMKSLTESGLQVDVADFSDPRSLEAINAFVNEQTRGRIPDVLDSLTKDNALVAVNAVYFKDRWVVPFGRDETKVAPFHLLDGGTVDVPLMHSESSRFRFRQDQRFVGVELPYATQGFSMVVVTTKAVPAAPKAFTGLADWLSAADFADSPGDVVLPRFGAQSSMDLLPALAALGFKPPARLPGFAKGPLRLSKAQQRVFLKVDEEGTEAAAATAVLATRSIENGYVRMIVDKPFVFALRDATTGLIIIAGYVGRPDAAASVSQIR